MTKHKWLLEYSGPPHPDLFDKLMETDEEGNPVQLWMRIWICNDCRTRQSALYEARGLPVIAPQQISDCSGKTSARV